MFICLMKYDLMICFLLSWFNMIIKFHIQDIMVSFFPQVSWLSIPTLIYQDPPESDPESPDSPEPGNSSGKPSFRKGFKRVNQ